METVNALVDQISQLTLAQAADLVKARAALRQIADEPLADCYNDNYAFDAMQTARDIASRTLAEIEKEARS